MRHSMIAVCILPLAACTVGPDYQRPAMTPDAAGRGHFLRAADPAYRSTPALARWWNGMGDPLMSALIEDALAHSPTVAQAQARIRETHASLRTERVDRLPNISASGTYLRASLPASGEGETGSDTMEIYNLGGMASWEPDLFGGGRRAVEKAGATLEQRDAELADTQVSLSAQVAQAYIALRDGQARLKIQSESVALMQRSLTLYQQRRDAGTASTLDVERMRNQMEAAEADISPLMVDIDDRLDELAILTGREPGALDARLSEASAVPLPPAEVAIGDPAALLAQRPDIRVAERALAASTAQIGVDKAKSFPSLKFQGLIGLGGSQPEDVLDPDKLTTLLAPMLSWSFLDFGRNRAAVSRSEAQRDAAEADYRQTILAALKDAEGSLSRFARMRLRLARLLRAEEAASRAAQLNGQRVAAGTLSLIDQLDVERQQRAAAMALSQGRAQVADSYVLVQKSLGLGWAVPTGQADR